jgi:hypothetical protein
LQAILAIRPDGLAPCLGVGRDFFRGKDTLNTAKLGNIGKLLGQVVATDATNVGSIYVPLSALKVTVNAPGGLVLWMMTANFGANVGGAVYSVQCQVDGAAQQVIRQQVCAVATAITSV